MCSGPQALPATLVIEEIEATRAGWVVCHSPTSVKLSILFAVRPRSISRWAFLVAAVVSSTLSITIAVHAENLREVPLGGRTATMGGAGVGAGVDAAMAFLNPAGMAGTPHDVASLSADVYSYASASVPRYFRPNGVSPKFGNVGVEDEAYDETQFATVPSGLTYFKRLGTDDDRNELVLGLSVTMPSYSWGTATGRFRGTSTSARLWADALGTNRFRQALAGPTIALRLGRRVRLGLSVLGSYADWLGDSQVAYAVALIDQTTHQETPNLVNQRVNITAWSVGLTPIAGAQINVWEDLWLGAAFEMRGIPLIGRGNILALSDASIVDDKGVTTTARSTQRGSFDGFSIARPMRVSLGAAWEAPGVFTVAADVHLFVKNSSFVHGSAKVDTLTIETNKPIDARANPFVFDSGTRTFADFSLGGEVHLSKVFALRAGFMTDLDSIERESNGTPNTRLDWVMGTLGLGVKTGALETTYGIAYRRGFGKVYVDDVFGDAKTPVPIDFTANAFMLILSGSVRTD